MVHSSFPHLIRPTTAGSPSVEAHIFAATNSTSHTQLEYQPQQRADETVSERTNNTHDIVRLLLHA